MASDEAFGLFDEPAVEHGIGALVDAFVETGARRVEAQPKDTVTGEGVSAFLPLDRHRSAAAGAERLIGCERDLDGADDFGDVVGVDGGGCLGVEASKDAVEIGRAAGCGEFAKAFALAGF